LAGAQGRGARARDPRFIIPRIEAALRMEALRPRPTSQVLVKFKTGVAPEAFARAFSQQAAQPQTRLQETANAPRPDAPALTYRRSNPAIGWHVFRLPSPDALPATLEALRRDPNVQYAEPDQHIRLLIDPPTNPRWGQVNETGLFTDVINNALPGFFEQPGRYYDTAGWHYNWTLEMVSALSAWNLYPGYYPDAFDRISQLASDPSRLPRVAVLDTGIDFDHPAFRYSGQTSSDISHGGQIATSLARSFFNGNRTDKRPIAAKDVFGHGTSVASLIGAAPNNGFGVPGLGFTCQIVPVRIYGDTGDGLDSDMVDAIVYATDAGCLLINISARTDLGYSVALQDAVNYAWDHGSLVIAAVGNDGDPSNIDAALTRRYPASMSHVLSVGATSYSGGDFDGYTGTYYPEIIADYSNYGPQLGVVAPGGSTFTYFLDNADGFFDDLLQAVLQQFAVVGVPIPPGTIPEFVYPYVAAPTYLVPLSNAGNQVDPGSDTPPPPNPFNEFALLGLYGLNEGSLPGTSFATPQVVGLAALYAAKNGITQETPDGPQRIVQAIQRGADALDNTAGGGFSLVYGYGRINAAATLLDLNRRNAVVGGIVGQVTYGGTAQSPINVVAKKVGSTTTAGQATTASPDGVFHLMNLREGNYTISATVLGTVVTRDVHVTAGCDVYADLRANEVHVSVTPDTVNVPYGGQQQFTAVVSGSSNPNVIWDLPVSAGAAITSDGLLTAPSKPGSSTQALVRATSVSNPNASATAIVNFGPVTISLAPKPAQVQFGKTLQVHATVGGTVDASVTWEVVSGGGSISDTGMYQAPPQPAHSLISRAVVVKATSVTDPTVSASLTIIVTSANGVRGRRAPGSGIGSPQPH
jgi:hypothetical protein